MTLGFATSNPHPSVTGLLTAIEGLCTLLVDNKHHDIERVIAGYPAQDSAISGNRFQHGHVLITAEDVFLVAVGCTPHHGQAAQSCTFQS